MTFKQELEAMRLEAYKIKNKSLYERGPGYYMGSIIVKRPKSAAQLEKLIIEFLKRKGHQAEKINTSGRVINNQKTFVDVVGRTRIIGSSTYIPTTGTKGSADISAIINGKPVKIEVKFSKSDRQSDYQKQYEQDVKRSGGLYWLVRNQDEFYGIFNGS